MERVALLKIKERLKDALLIIGNSHNLWNTQGVQEGPSIGREWGSSNGERREPLVEDDD